MELSYCAGLSSLEILQVEASYQVLVAPNMFTHQVYLENRGVLSTDWSVNVCAPFGYQKLWVPRKYDAARNPLLASNGGINWFHCQPASSKSQLPHSLAPIPSARNPHTYLPMAPELQCTQDSAGHDQSAKCSVSSKILFLWARNWQFIHNVQAYNGWSVDVVGPRYVGQVIKNNTRVVKR